jgi:hypothetical protein
VPGIGISALTEAMVTIVARSARCRKGSAALTTLNGPVRFTASMRSQLSGSRSTKGVMSSTPAPLITPSRLLSASPACRTTRFTSARSATSQA